jgi:hypothetical protein
MKQADDKTLAHGRVAETVQESSPDHILKVIGKPTHNNIG